MELKLTGIFFTLFTLFWTGQISCAADSSTTQPKDTIAVIGTGDMGNSFGPRLASLGYRIVYGSRNPTSDKVTALVKQTGNGASATTQRDAAQQGDVVLLALGWPAMETVTQSMGNLDGKVLIDLSYPPMIVADDGYFQITVETSSAEMIQNWNPGAKVVKAFGTLGSDAIDDPKSIGGPLTVPIASDHRDAKEKVARITAELGLDPVDAGPLRIARNIESLQILLMVPLLQKRDAAWDIYFRRSNYWMCNPYVTADGVYEFPTAPDADNLAEIPYTQGLPEPCP